MKIQLEKVIPGKGQSFKIFTPRLKQYFYWHYHPEFELTFVEAPSGIRHVGQHVSSYLGSDLIFIGSNIPHLNFDYELQTDYRQIVIQMKEDFVGTALRASPELAAIQQLFDRSALALSFYGQTKRKAVEKMQRMLRMSPFEQLLCLLEVFQLLANSSEYELLNDRDTSVKLFLKDKIRMSSVYEYIHASFNENPDVNEIAAKVNLSTAAFCRYFKKQTNMTFTDFVNQYRISQAKTYLLNGMNISETTYAVGFSSLSHFSQLFKKMVGDNPSEFKRKLLEGKGE
ncbi:MAG: helix-turn-helix domain-containing protein [Cyclobacteriaceae bacterium]|jgi:AraC-like DNA-binding protein|nr:AraC family transcriptional regulator [Flammeovirgaceae bacterium]